MKKALLLLVVLLGCLCAKAQEQRSPYYFGGDFGLSLGSGGTSISVYPEIGRRIAPNLYAGIQAGGGYYRNSSYSDFTMGFAPHLRYYWFIYKRFGLYGEAGFSLGFTRRSNWEPLIRSFDIGLRPGIIIPIASGHSLTLQLGFLGYESDNFGNGTSNNHWGFRLQGHDIRIGYLMNL